MGFNSSIEWTESTWNPVTGCTKISEGCVNCYAERMANRLRAMGMKNYIDGFKVSLHPHILELPLTWTKPQIVFVNSMSDLFHNDIPLSFIQQVFNVMNRAYWHRFQVLTKRAGRLAELAPLLIWPDNVWIGVTVENSSNLDRIDYLHNIPAAVRFLSLEPLLGPLNNIDLCNIDWVIVGGESGPGARLMKEEWILDILHQCQKAGVAFFFKQWGGIHKKRAGRTLNNRVYSEMPNLNILSNYRV